MPLSREFRDNVQARAERDPDFREELLAGAVQLLLDGDMDDGKAELRRYINATIGFEQLGVLTNKQPKSLMRMLSPAGNPQAGNLLAVISSVQRFEGVELRVSAVR